MRCIDEAVQQGLPHKSRSLPGGGSHGSLRTLLSKTDRMFDILNSRHSEKCTPLRGSDDSQLAELLDSLHWFAQWKHGLDMCTNLSAKDRAASFLPAETWAETIGICLMPSCMAREFLDGHTGRCIVLRQFNQDCVENHFANLRWAACGKLTIENARASTSAASAQRNAGSLANFNKVNFAGAARSINEDTLAPLWTKLRLEGAQKRHKLLQQKQASDRARQRHAQGPSDADCVLRCDQLRV